MTAIQPDTKEACRFLNVLRPGGPWVLTAISVDQKNIETETFTDLSAADNWISARNGKLNLYFMVNPAMRPLSSKAKKTDVRGLEFLHLDIDPRENEPLDQERKRIRDLLFKFDPPPTFIVDSGGGYQSFWRLDAEQVINGDEAKAIELEAYNIQLELLTNADACHNLDRIMRLPGTLNRPSEKKRKKGRVEALAMVVREGLNCVYPLDVFTPAQRVVSTGTGSAAVKISQNLPRIDLDDLPAGVSQRTKMLIVQGNDPDDPARYPSQSEVVFAVAGEMIRAGCTDDQIAAVLLDQDFGVSAHIYRQGRPQDYAVRQIRRAREGGAGNAPYEVIGGALHYIKWKNVDDSWQKEPMRLCINQFISRRTILLTR